jgi:hypothetical protein
MVIQISRDKELDRWEKRKLLWRLAQGRIIPIARYMRDHRQHKNAETDTVKKLQEGDYHILVKEIQFFDLILRGWRSTVWNSQKGD